MATVDDNALAKFLSRVADKMDEEKDKMEKENKEAEKLKKEAAAVLDLDLDEFTFEIGTQSGPLDLSGNAASGSKSGSKPQTGADAESLEDLVTGLQSQINSSDSWLTENTATKWKTDNPELAEQYLKAMEQDKDKEF
ncbi:uncharacterized protein LOC132555541 [Ylistrum balloti]|uniref:uncharacterized protein LOC132555541 n=1 Tax=Ylistrum balloti TaxID=509963 RepID=UPI002905B3E2|nr:uncharacterized protein LOC132555541 [Ylistrum balloti]